jgi:hypothetical protein
VIPPISFPPIHARKVTATLVAETDVTQSGSAAANAWSIRLVGPPRRVTLAGTSQQQIVFDFDQKGLRRQRLSGGGKPSVFRS